MRLPTLIAAVATIGLVGCTSPQGGGMAEGTGFKIAVPLWTVDVKQGETKSVTIKLNRGDYFKQDVRLRFTASQGISVEPATAVVRASDPPQTDIRIAAPSNAALGKYHVNIEGTPERGETTGIDMTVKVVMP
ncbi:MAG: hypothetical protein LLG01_19220 [Planctomycetaceae bacterium]|nr:hypothetical protein [Planctomycetaceae bacterium]